MLTRSIEITKRAMAASGFKMSEINEVIFVGGQTRMPAIVEAVKALYLVKNQTVQLIQMKL
jgi:molecular chaperone DnaK